MISLTNHDSSEVFPIQKPKTKSAQIAPGLTGEQLKGPSNRAATEHAIAPYGKNVLLQGAMDGLFFHGKIMENPNLIAGWELGFGNLHFIDVW